MTTKKSPGKGSGGTTHVVPNPDGGWDVKRGGQPKPISHHETKKPAVDAGRRASRAAGTEFYEHGRDGRIQRKDSHGNDPRRTKG